jgi:glycosyltransferase involved in cell wall biosynthesis
MNPFVSIIIANYNKRTLLNETIDSVIEQSYQNWELIIVDDHSTDHSALFIKDNYKDDRIKLTVNEINRGANFCRNKGISLAKGEYIIFLDADDLLIPQCLMDRVKVANENPLSNLLVFTMGVFYKKAGDTSGNWIPNSKYPLKDFLQHKLPWSILQPLWKKETLVNLNGFDESFQRLQDVELHTRALLNEKINYVLRAGEPDCYYRIDEDRKTFNSYDFLSRWVDSALKYCNKFYEIVPEKLKPSLLGTIFQTYLQVIYQLKLKKITKQEFRILNVKLLSCKLLSESGTMKKMLFKVAGAYNLYFFRIPGLNMVIKNMILR